jgi:uncharacterized membrane protein
MTKKPVRIWQFDLIRAIAIILMTIYHFFFLINFYGIQEVNLASWWLFLAEYASKLTFLLLVGFFIGFSVQKITNRKAFLVKQLKRVIVITLAAALISFVTYLTIDNSFVRFGILHLIASGILIFSLIARNNYLVLLIIIISLGFWLLASDFFFRGNYLTYALGLNYLNPYSIDYFGLFPWLAIIGLGVLHGKKLGTVVIFQQTKEPRSLKFMTFLGRHSLLIYLIHVPLIALILWLLGFEQIKIF